MKRLLRSAAYLFAMAAFGAAAQDGPRLDFSALQGCWKSEQGDTTIEEQWMAPRSGIMLGMSRSVRDGEAIGHEFLRLQDTGDGITLTAWPSGQDEASFRLVKHSKSVPVSIGEESPYGDDIHRPEPTDVEWVFENPDHDFPKRIIYRIGDNVLHASIHATTEVEDPEDEGRRVDFRYERVACPE